MTHITNKTLFPEQASNKVVDTHPKVLGNDKIPSTTPAPYRAS